MLLESFSQSVLRWLRIPPGTSLRHPNEVSTSGASVDDNPYIETIVSITVDDICIGEEPLSIDYKDDTPELTQIKFKEICNECNTIVKDAATDLCKIGYSVYTAGISSKNKLILLPYVDMCSFWLTKEKKVVVCDEEDNPLENVIVFINFAKADLVKIEDTDREHSEYAFQIIPSPMQLKNIQGTINSLQRAEDNLDRYRALSSRIARWANVNVGTSQGDQQKDVIDTISSAINANSAGLGNTLGNSSFDDNIPVLPNRNGLGEVTLTSDVPNYNLKDLGDVDHYLSKLTLQTRFPSTYMDFSQNLDQAAASLIRGDIRYYKLCNKVRSKIANTLNDFINSSEQFAKWEPVFTLTQLPSSEDEDVMEALSQYVDLASSVEDFVMGEDMPKEIQLHRLRLLQDLFASSTTSPALQKWFLDYRSFIEKYDANVDEEGEGGDLGGGGQDLGEGDFGGGGDFDIGEPGGGGAETIGSESSVEPPASEAPEGAPDDVEFFEPPAGF